MRLLLLALLVAGAGAAQAQQMYRWTDKNGKVNYGQNPPPGVVAKAVRGGGSGTVSSSGGAGTVSTVGSAPHIVKNNATPLREGEVKPGFDPRKQY